MRPLGFFSRRLNKSQIKWTIFSRELLAVYLAAKHFLYFLEGYNFTIQTDHQALVNAAAHAKPRECAREARHLQYLTALRPRWQFITGSSNNTADALSHATPENTSNSSVSNINKERSLDDYEAAINTITSSLQHREHFALRRHQAVDTELCLLLTNEHSTKASVKLELINGLFCTVTGPNVRIYIPHPLQNTMLHDIQDASHPGLRTTLREATRLYFWPNMRRDINSWTQACQRCQGA